MDCHKAMGKNIKLQLICIGYAGSIAANFNFLIPYLGDEIELSVVEYKGRGTRRNESVYKDNEELVADVAEQIKGLRKDRLPYAILGYSMGVQVVYELFAKELLDEDPAGVFLAAHEPPDVDCFGKSVNLEEDDEFIALIQNYGGMDERLLADKRFREIYLSRLKGDYRLLKEYQFSGEYHKITVPMVVFYCENDTPYEKMKGWGRFSAGKIKFYRMGQDHFFFKSDTEEFCKVICEELDC